MNYQRIYDEFVVDRRQKEPLILRGKKYTTRNSLGAFHEGKYYEHHHIIPVSCGGNDDADNVISVSADDHLFCHVLLAKIWGGRMWTALFLMCGLIRYGGRQSRFWYSISKSSHAAVQKETASGEQNPFFGKRHSDTVIQKLSESAKLRFRDKQKHPMFGKKLSLEVREGIRASQTGRKASDATRHKMRSAKIGKPSPMHDPAVLAKFIGKKRPQHSEDMKGTKNPMYGVDRADIRGKNSKVAKAVICLDNGRVYDAIAEAAKELGVPYSAVSACCRGKRNKTGGLRFRFYADNSPPQAAAA